MISRARHAVGSAARLPAASLLNFGGRHGGGQRLSHGSSGTNGATKDERDPTGRRAEETWFLNRGEWPEDNPQGLADIIAGTGSTLASSLHALQGACSRDDDQWLLMWIASAHGWSRVLAEHLDVYVLAAVDEFEIVGEHFSSSFEAAVSLWDRVFLEILRVSGCSTYPSSTYTIGRDAEFDRGAVSSSIVAHLPIIRAALPSFLASLDLGRLVARVLADSRKVLAAARSSSSDAESDRAEPAEPPSQTKADLNKALALPLVHEAIARGEKLSFRECARMIRKPGSHGTLSRKSKNADPGSPGRLFDEAWKRMVKNYNAQSDHTNDRRSGRATQRGAPGAGRVRDANTGEFVPITDEPERQDDYDGPDGVALDDALGTDLGTENE